MSFARFGAAFITATIAWMGAWGGVHAQEASAEITATATVTPPPIEISENDLNFGSLFPGDTVNIESNDFRGWGAEDHWPGRLEIENLFGGGAFSVRFIAEPLSNGDATLEIIWDSDGHAGAYIERIGGVGNDPTGYYSWIPVSGEVHTLFTSSSAGQGNPTNPVINATVFIGGRVEWVGDEPPGVYTGSIKVEVGFLDQ
jgi:hypothetical protein